MQRLWVYLTKGLISKNDMPNKNKRNKAELFHEANNKEKNEADTQQIKNQG